MKKFSHRIIAFLMAFVVLFSTMSFTISMHFCGDTLVETALFHSAKGCGMEMEKASLDGCSVTKSNCCENKQLSLDGQDELRLKVETNPLAQQLFVSSFLYAITNFSEFVHINVFSYQEYREPLVNKELYKLDETYLI